MNAPTPRETWARAKRSVDRGQRLGWAIGILLALSGAVLAASPAFWLGRARTEGTVTKLEPEVELVGHGNPQAGEIVWYEEVMVAYPVVAYQVDGRTYSYRPRWSFRTYSVGDRVPVLYKVNRPGTAGIDTFSERWLAPLTVGGVFVLLGVAMMVVTAFSGRMFRQLEATLREGDGRTAQTASSTAEPPYGVSDLNKIKADGPSVVD
jgi:hypothetical protein